MAELDRALIGQCAPAGSADPSRDAVFVICYPPPLFLLFSADIFPHGDGTQPLVTRDNEEGVSVWKKGRGMVGGRDGTGRDGGLVKTTARPVNRRLHTGWEWAGRPQGGREEGEKWL